MRTVNRWAEAGLLSPEGNSHCRYRDIDILACAMAKDLSARGFTREACFQVAGWIRARSLDELQDDWKYGRNLMLLVGEKPKFLRLFTRGWRFSTTLPSTYRGHIDCGHTGGRRQCRGRVSAAYRKADRALGGSAVRPYLTPSTLAAIWGCKPATVIAMIRRGDLQAVNMAVNPAGRPHWKITRHAIRDFERARTTEPLPKRKRQRVPRNVKEFFK